MSGAPAETARPPHGMAMLAVLAAVLVVASTAAWFASRGDWSALQSLGVSTLERPYGDARTISGAAIALDRGLDPLADNPGDPWGRTMDYPRLWLGFVKLGLGPDRTWILVAAFFTAALAGGFALSRLVHDRVDAMVLILGIGAPTTWLALERANNDLLIFGMCCVAAPLAARRRTSAAVLLAGAAALKLYPVAGAAALLGVDARASRRALVPLLGVFAAYVAWTFADVLLMQQGATRAEWLAYGVDILPIWLAKNTPLGHTTWLALAVATMAAAMFAALSWRRRSRLHAVATPALASFRLGAAIYLGTFALGQSFDYRLLFLLPTLPQLTRWARNARGPARTLAAVATVVQVLLLWGLTWRALLQPLLGTTLPLAIDELLAWSNWFALANLFVLALPQWCLPKSWRLAQLVDEPAPAGEPVAPIDRVRRAARRTGS